MRWFRAISTGRKNKLDNSKTTSLRKFFYKSMMLLLYLMMITHVFVSKEICVRNFGCIAEVNQPYAYYFVKIILTLPFTILFLFMILEYVFFKNYTSRKLRDRIDIYLSRNNQLYDKNYVQIDDRDSSN